MAQYVTGFVAEGAPQVFLAFNRLRQAVLRIARVNPRASALLSTEINYILQEFERDLTRIERQTAVRVTRGMKRRVKQTQVRPDNTSRLHDALIAEPLTPYTSIPTGSVGIANIPKLDHEVVNPRGHYGPYWRVQEGIGDQEFYTGHVGREVRGGFYTASGRGPFKPSQANFRASPVFIPGPGGRMVIQRPIKARHFIRDTFAAERPVWLRKMTEAEDKAIRRLNALF